jgi:peroxiredoxin
LTDERTLHDRIDTEVVQQIPESLAEKIDRMVDDLRARGVTPGIPVGAPAPLFEAADARGTLVRLADELARGPVVLSFYRGAWCPICSLELRALRDILPELVGAGASLLAISPQAPDDSLPLVESLDLGFSVVSDLDQSIIAAYGLQFELPDELKDIYEQFGLPLTKANADGTWNLPVPATFVIDRAGIVRACHVDPDYRTRMEPAHILAAVRAL